MENATESSQIPEFAPVLFDYGSMTSADSREPAHATTTHGIYPIVVATFVALLLMSNIGAVKLIGIGPIITDGGAFLFPLTYIVGDVLSEIYGFRAARRAILTALVLQLIAALTFWAATAAPAAEGWTGQAAYASVVGFVPRIVSASVLAFFVGELLNSYVLVWIKQRTRERHLWVRLIGSTVVGELLDTVIFCTVAFVGVISAGELLNYIATGYVYKTALEVLLLPVTYRVIAAIKRREPDYGRRA